MADDYLVMGPDGRQMLKSQFDAENQRAFNTSRLNSLLSAPVGAGVYGALDQAGVDPEIRDRATGITSGFEGIAQGALGARGGMHSENMLNAPAKTVIKRNPGPAAVPPRADYGLNKEDWQEALHATPYKFNKFDMSKIGTGEGSFMPDFIGEHGHGMYLTNRKDTAQAYVNSIGQGVEDKTGEAPTMRVKRVAVPSNDYLINKDARSVAAQPEPVQQRLQARGITAEPTANMETLMNRLGRRDTAAGRKQAAETLESAGIPGLRYDGYMQSQAGDWDKSNFVMWDASKMRPLRGKIPDRAPLIIEPHRSTPDDGKPVRQPDPQLVTRNNLYQGKAPIGDAYEEKPWTVKGQAPDTPKYVPDPGNDDDWNDFIDWKHKNPPPEGEDSVDMWKKFSDNHPSNSYVKQLDKLTQQHDKWGNKADPDEKPEFLAQPKATSFHALPDGAALESSPWHAPFAMYNDFMDSGYAPVSGLPETEDAWKAWQQAGMPKQKTAETKPDLSPYLDQTGQPNWKALGNATKTMGTNEATKIWLDTMKAIK